MIRSIEPRPTGLHFAPFWLWLNGLDGAFSVARGPYSAATGLRQLWLGVGAALVVGRGVALIVEGWVLLRYLGLLSRADPGDTAAAGAGGGGPAAAAPRRAGGEEDAATSWSSATGGQKGIRNGRGGAGV